MKLEPIPQGSLVDAVIERIRDGIEKNGLAPGDRLPSEFALMSSLRVSRRLLREVVGRLEAIGLVKVRRGSGMYVADRDLLATSAKLLGSALTISPRELALFVDLRGALECLSARRAAERATLDDLADLEQLCEAIDVAGIEHHEAIRRDFEFHRKIVAIAANPLVENILEVVREMILEAMDRTAIHPRERKYSQALHRKILSAISEHDPEAAEQAMRNHMDEILQRLKASDSQQ